MAGTAHTGFRLTVDPAAGRRARSDDPCCGEGEFAAWVLGDTI